MAGDLEALSVARQREWAQQLADALNEDGWTDPAEPIDAAAVLDLLALRGLVLAHDDSGLLASAAFVAEIDDSAVP